MTIPNHPIGRLSSLGPLVLRLAVGGVMAYHGIDKLRGGIGGVEEMFRMWQVPAPAITAPLVAGIEILGGLALVVGIGTRVAAGALAVVLVGAIVFVKTDLGIISSEPMPGAELDIALLGGLAALMLLGPGTVSADRALGLEPVPLAAERLVSSRGARARA
ncbi:MAG: DoxX family protein [Actinobacteria bacterium]|nr:DoxX family protein [Actinomycetota bacterium]MBW3650142.1 DoxX family protein [Actinomycetota bacterium]